jgi:hypothetical protein
MKTTHSLDRHLSIARAAALTVLAGIIAGCSAEEADETVTPRIEVTNQRLSAATVTTINGTYGAACDGRSIQGTDTWTVVLADAEASTLSVRKNDTDCELTVTSLAAGSTFIAAPAITLGTSWKLTASAFATDGGPLAFYGNGMISSTAFADDPTISILVSDDTSAAQAPDKSANFATQTAEVSAAAVPASDYTVSFADFNIEKDVNHVVQSVSGYAQLVEGLILGEDYAIHHGSLTGASTFEEVDAAYDGAAVSGLLTSLTTLQLPATAFGLHDPAVDLDDEIYRTVIIRNTDDGVSSYQLILVRFTP